MQTETLDIALFIRGAYGATLALFGLFLLASLWRRMRARAALRRFAQTTDA